jgi:hypothetical protein
MSGVEFSGDRITLLHEADRDTLVFDDKGTGRVCGQCQLCCKLLPVPGPPLFKLAGVKCRHQKHGKGCMIYASRPTACRVFACRWLADRETAGMPRPDRAHYVIDVASDYVEAVEEATGKRTRIGVVQVWIDPAYPDAYRTPELTAYMLHIATTYRMATIIRQNSREAFTVFPPPLSSDGQWHEITGNIVTRDADDAQIMQDLEGRQQ